MIGAFIGDVAGSCYVNSDKNFLALNSEIPLFNEKCKVTECSIQTYAIYEALSTNFNFFESLKKYSELELDINSNSNDCGAAMRISPVGYYFNSIKEIKLITSEVCCLTHRNYEARLCAEAVAVAICLLKHGYSKNDVRNYIKNNYFEINFDLNELKQNYCFSEKSYDVIPQAFAVFFESNDFEDAIRNAIAIGGNSSVIASIVGSIAGAYYEVPENLINDVKSYLNDYMLPIIEKNKCMSKKSYS